MTLDDRQMRELEANERWLRGEDDLIDAPEADGPNVDALKLRARIEVHEQWLGERWTDAVPAGLVERAKARVHDEITATKRDAARGGHRLLRWGAGVALAAAACLAIFVGLPPSESQETENWLLDAFEAYSQEGDDETLAMLGDDLTDLEFAFLGSAIDVLNEGRVDELLNDIQNFDLDDTYDDDWS